MTKLGSLLALFSKQERGAALILFAVLIPVMMGIIGLVLDGGRVFIMNNEQQDLADAAALAGASKLDGTQEGMDAAVLAAQNLIAGINPEGLTEGGDGTQIGTIRFCSSPLGANPWTPATCTPTVDPALADFIEVRTITRNVSPVFTVALGADSDAASNAVAIAGSTIVACNVQPLMLCNPFYPTEFHATPGQMFVFQEKQGGGFAPGNFGLLDPPGQIQSGGAETRRLLSQQSPRFCYINQASPRTGGSNGPVEAGINVRFDMQPNGPGVQTGMDLTPAPNVIKGKIPNNSNNCRWTGNNFTDTPSARFPRDISIAGITDFQSVGIGDGQMDPAAKNAFWQYHHGTDWPSSISTRYEAYLHQLQMASSDWTGLESADPECTSTPAGPPERRVISVMIVHECDISGNSVPYVRSNRYADFFITEPVPPPIPGQPGSDGRIYTEFVRLVEAGDDDGRLRHIVQLYR